jgi:hypothetical protein
MSLAECAALIPFDAALAGSVERETGGLSMNAPILFRTSDIRVTPTTARFGLATYQIAMVSSVAVYQRQRLNPAAVALVLTAVALAGFAWVMREQYPDYSLWSVVAAPVALIVGVALQRFRPVVEYHFMMKSAGGEVETVTTFDREQVLALREAFERAFDRQRRPSELADTVRVESPATADPRPDLGLHITRDWLVANAEPATR